MSSLEVQELERARDFGYRDVDHLQHEFEKAARIVRDDDEEHVREATSADKLRLYGYYKQVRGRSGRGRSVMMGLVQATCGTITAIRPKIESLREVAKWEVTDENGKRRGGELGRRRGQ
eukprot:762475-Hanusia_phi.AAC.1